jgi:hypothetical protein
MAKVILKASKNLLGKVKSVINIKDIYRNFLRVVSCMCLRKM